MERLTEKQYQAALKRIQYENLYKERNRKLKEEKNKLKLKLKLPSTTKLMAAYLFIIMNVVLIYSLVIMYEFRDLTYLGVLITDIAGQVLVYWIYSLKSRKENCKDGITYDLAMMEKRHELGLYDTTTTLPPSSDDEDAVG